MSHVTGNTGLGIGGEHLGLGIGGKGVVVILFGSGDPNNITDGSVTNAAVGSLFLRLDGSTNTTLYVRTAFPANTWTAK